MIRLLIAVGLVGLTVALVISQQKSDNKEQVIYQEQMDKAEAVESLLQEQAKQQQRKIDEISRQ